MSQFDCDYPCPKCGAKVELFGTDCYPDEGIVAECTNLSCDYELVISCSIRTNLLRDTVREAHSIMCRLLKQHPTAQLCPHCNSEDTSVESVYRCNSCNGRFSARHS